MICNLGVVGSNPTRGSKKGGKDRRKLVHIARESKNGLGVFQSGQMGQTVNLLSFDFGGSNPSAPTSRDVCGIECKPSAKLALLRQRPRDRFCGNSSVDRALAFQAGGRGFEPRFPLILAVIAQW